MATEEDKKLFKCLLEEKLNRIIIPSQITESRDLDCKDRHHLEAIDGFMLETLNAIQEACEESLPGTGDSGKCKRRKVMPGFNEYVKPLKEKSIF